MKIITRFSYENLRNEAHVEFHTSFNSKVEQFTPEALGIAARYAIYKPLFDEEVQALDQIRKSARTYEIIKAERERDRLFRGLRNIGKSSLLHFDDAKRDAARKIKIILDYYGNITYKSYDEKSAALEDLHRELLKPENFVPVTILGLDEWLAQLAQANDCFKALMVARYEETARRPNLQMAAIRKEVDKNFRAILNLLEALVQVQGPGTNKEFLAALNAIMKRYKDIIAQASGRRRVITECD
ncbi:MAG: DUF6261 family protein [Prevotellaceae bacterium]|jgi:hypothetical protein|nr:DUF6261 family protein [Prevotellaceae bacterium]